MSFWGRSIDTFEAAIKMLFINESFIDHLDCVSGRAFSICRDDIHLLFSCTLSDEDAVDNINKYYGNVFEIVSPIGLSLPFVMPVHSFMEMPTIFRNYFPYGHYVQCVIEDDILVVNDPDGFPRLSFNVDDCTLEKFQVIIRHSNLEIIGIDYSQVLSDMFNTLRKEVVCHGESNRIFLQYAVRNYLRQISKVVRLLQETVGLTKTSHLTFTDLFSDMVSQKTNSVERILRIDRQIWSFMEEIWCSKR